MADSLFERLQNLKPPKGPTEVINRENIPGGVPLQESGDNPHWTDVLDKLNSGRWMEVPLEERLEQFQVATSLLNGKEWQGYFDKISILETTDDDDKREKIKVDITNMRKAIIDRESEFNRQHNQKILGEWEKKCFGHTF